MLQVKNVVKTYNTGDIVQNALKGISISFRDNEFVSILGPSGSGKTTLLNIIGGLDRYTEGDLIINGVSTKTYNDSSWDIYRNNKIGFVFQGYNLIPHQSVLANVEMALTLSGVSKKERKRRASAVLEKVGLGAHLHKKPNQLSGGQMQRVAIARALVNDPDILLADEPTGALDSDTGIHIMELLKEIAGNKLVIMVTHNPELAEKYSTRIVKLKDGNIISDSDPYDQVDRPKERKKQKKVSMSFLTALSLSFNNLRTKKGRTILTAFAGSIGIIGIAMILSLSSGMTAYINNIQKETMNEYPITINEKALDGSFLSGLRNKDSGEGNETEKNGVYANCNEIKAEKAFVSNNLAAFKKYLDDPENEITKHLGERGVVYGYDVAFDVYSYDSDGKLINSNSSISENGGSLFSSGGGFLNKLTSGMGGASGADNFSEMMSGVDGEYVSRAVTDGYEILYGRWPNAYNEVMLVLDSQNSINANTLYQLGLITGNEYKEISEKIKNGEDTESIVLDYAAVCDHAFYLVAACDRYKKNDDGKFSYIDEETVNTDILLNNALELKITGVIRPTSDSSAPISTAVAYTKQLTDHIIRHTVESPVITAQKNTPDINVLTGLKFKADSDEEKISMVKEYIGNMGVSEKASVYKLIMYYNTENGIKKEDADKPSSAPVANTSVSSSSVGKITKIGSKSNDKNSMGFLGRLLKPINTLLQKIFGIFDSSDKTTPDKNEIDEELMAAIIENWLANNADKIDFGSIDDETMAAIIGGWISNSPDQSGVALTDESTMAKMLDNWLENTPDNAFLLDMYDKYIGGSGYDDNMIAFGSVNYDTPSSISLYVDNFEDKEAIADCINNYNAAVDEDSKIFYTDYVAMMTSSLTGIINGISYVLIAFIAVSLIVSCIMIGIITHISVMERAKEIGILRALGASKGNVSQVFNAETFILGCTSGLIGIGITFCSLFPINHIIACIASMGGRMSGLAGMSAQLPLSSAVVLIIISIIVTMLGGLLPAKKAAKKDPVEALRTE